MKSVICLALAFGIFIAGCAEKESGPVIVSLTDQENPIPAIETPVEPVTKQEVKTEDVAEQANKYREPDVIFVPTPQNVVDKMLELAQVNKDDLLYDLGCGDGRIVVTAAKRYGCRAVGYDIDPERVKESLENVQKNNVGHLVAIEQKDIFTLDLSEANVITLYLLPSLNVKLFPQLEKLKPGSRIVSHDFRMRGIKPDKVIRLNSNYDQQEHKIYLWTTPLTVKVKENPDSAQE
jgi:SAM-dependent methyltransferase